MAKGLFLGLTTVDLLYGTRTHPGADEKMRADWQLALAGGPAANAAVAFAAFGHESHLISGLGTHPAAAIAAVDLDVHNVIFHDRAKHPTALPVLSSILVNSSTAKRCVLYSNTEGYQLKDGGEIETLLEKASVLLLDGFYLDQAVRLAHEAKSRNIPVVLDGGSWKDGLDALLPLIDYAICSGRFMPPGCRSDSDVFAYLSDYKTQGSAISRGGEALLAWIGGIVHPLKVPGVKAIDTLGAGDILHGAFCHFIISSSFVESLKSAILVASESCRFYGTRKWIDNLEPAVKAGVRE